MRRRLLIFIGGVGVAIGLGIGLLTVVAPQSSPIRLLGGDAAGCLRDAAGACLVLPAVSGTTLSDQPIALPDDLATGYTLVVMPFDQAQQEAAADWLAPFAALAAQYDALSYLNIAALPDLSRAIRTLVVGGLRLSVRDAATQDRIVLLFLEDQAAFLTALGLSDDTLMQLFVVDEAGTIYWRGSGAYAPSTEDALRDFVAQLLG